MTEPLKAFPTDSDAMSPLPASVAYAPLEEIAATAIERKLAVSAPGKTQVKDGAPTAYGIIQYEAGVQAAHSAGTVLKRANPGPLPVQIAELILAINLKTAAAVDLTIPDGMLPRDGIVIYGDGQE